MSYWDTADNYGTVLQHYALQIYLRSLGHEPFLIRFRFSESVREKIIRAWKSGGFLLVLRKSARFLISRISGLRKFLRRKGESLRDFEGFRNAYFSMSVVYRSYEQLKQNPPEADMYIAGSDQIWNTGGASEIGESILVYLLSFVSGGTRRVACAASFGTREFASAMSASFKIELSKFDFISVRDQGSVDICKSLGFESAVLQPDPTMLLAVSDYRDIECETIDKTTPYILLYLLNNTTDFSIRRLKSFAARHGLEVVYVSANCDYIGNINLYAKECPTIHEWLRLYDGASFVVTNSFHGTVFSLIYNKNFLFAPQCGKYKNQNTRILSLLDYFGLDARIFADGNLESLMHPVDWSSVNVRLEEIREYSPFATYVRTSFSEETRRK